MVIEQSLVSGVVLWCQINDNPNNTYDVFCSNVNGTDTYAGFVLNRPREWLVSLGVRLHDYIYYGRECVEPGLDIQTKREIGTAREYIKVAQIGFLDRMEAKLLLRTLSQQFALAT